MKSLQQLMAEQLAHPDAISINENDTQVSTGDKIKIISGKHKNQTGSVDVILDKSIIVRLDRQNKSVELSTSEYEII